MNRVPAKCFPVGHILLEEMQERGWSSRDVAARMATGVEARAVWELTVDLLIHCSDDTPIIIGQETADALGAAFDTSPQFWINLNDSYQTWRKARGAHESPTSAN